MSRQEILCDVLATIPAETCPDCGDPSPGGAKCAACREYDNILRDGCAHRTAVVVAHVEGYTFMYCTWGCGKSFVVEDVSR